jgi:hypothetical protein
MSEYRDNAEPEEPKPPSVEDGLREVLMATRPFNEDDTTRILLAVAALYSLPIERRDESEDE